VRRFARVATRPLLLMSSVSEELDEELSSSDMFCWRLAGWARERSWLVVDVEWVGRADVKHEMEVQSGVHSFGM
jgi:hypothetical protein